MNTANRIKRAVTVVAGVASLVAASPTLAISFDFEDGTLQGWLATTTGGSGTTLVETHNASEMASVKHTHFAHQPGTSSHALSHDFTYVAVDLLSFDMQAVAVPSSLASAAAGVTLSFLNAFNVSLGSFSLFNATSPGSLGTHEFAVDNLQHHYGATMATFAAQAGLSPSLPISKISLSFVSYANSYGAALSTGSVWFDNVQVVPEPATQVLLLAGLGMTAIAAWRRRRL